MSTNEIARLSRQQARSPPRTHCIGFPFTLGHIGSALDCIEMYLFWIWGRCIQDIKLEESRMGIPSILTR